MDSQRLRVEVECRNSAGDSGYFGQGLGAHHEPCRFFFGQREVVTVDVIDRWLAFDHRYFKLRGDDDATYILRHDLPTNRWELTLYDSLNWFDAKDLNLRSDP